MVQLIALESKNVIHTSVRSTPPPLPRRDIVYDEPHRKGNMRGRSKVWMP